MVITQLSFDDGLCICSDFVRFSAPHQQSGWKRDGCKGFFVFRAAGLNGFVYAVQTLKQLMPAQIYGQIVRLNAMLQEYAGANRIKYVDYHSAMKDDHGGLSTELAKGWSTSYKRRLRHNEIPSVEGLEVDCWVKSGANCCPKDMKS